MNTNTETKTLTKGRFEQICLGLKPEIENIRRDNLETQIEIVEPVTDARSAVLIELLRRLYAELGAELPGRLQPVVDPSAHTREATIKSAVLRFVDAHSGEWFDPMPSLN